MLKRIKILIAFVFTALFSYSQYLVDCNQPGCYGFQNRDIKQLYQAVMAVSGSTNPSCSFTTCSPFSNSDLKQLYGAILTITTTGGGGTVTTSGLYSRTGNTLTSTDVLGSTNNVDLNIITNNTQRLKITSTGSVNIGNATTTNQKILRVGEGTSFIDFGERVSGQPGIWFNQSTPAASLVAIAGSSVGATVLNGAGTGGIDIRSFGSNILILKGAQTFGANVSYNFTPLPKTNQSAEANTIRVDGGSTQYSVSSVPIHREYYFRTNAVSATVPCTVTDMHNGYFETNTSGTNVTTTRNWALGAIGNTQITGSLVVGSSTVSPITTLDVRGSLYVSGASTLSNTTVSGSLGVVGIMAFSPSTLTPTTPGSINYNTALNGFYFRQSTVNTNYFSTFTNGNQRLVTFLPSTGTYSGTWLGSASTDNLHLGTDFDGVGLPSLTVGKNQNVYINSTTFTNSSTFNVQQGSATNIIDVKSPTNVSYFKISAGGASTFSAPLTVSGYSTTLTNVSASNATVTSNMYVGGTGVPPTADLHLAPGVNTPGGASLKFTAGSLLTTPEAGAFEFLGKYYGTDGTGPTRREFCQNNAPLTLGQIPVTNANGFFDGLSNFTHDGSRLFPKYITLSAGTTAANTSPLRFASGPLMTTPQSGSIEFLTDKFYGTSSTPTRYEFTLNNIALTAGRVPFSTTNGRLTDLAGFTYATNRLSPTYVTLGAGAAAAGSAPLVMTTGPVLTTPIAGACEYTTPQKFFTNGRLIRQEIPQIQQSRVSSNFNATSNITLANITGLTANVATSGTYKFRAVLYTTSDVAAGVKFSIGGTAIATSIIYETLVTNAGVTTQTRANALAATVGAVTAVTAAYCVIEGIITVTTAGTLTVQFAQNVSNAVSSVVLAGSNFQIQEML